MCPEEEERGRLQNLLQISALAWRGSRTTHGLYSDHHLSGKHNEELVFGCYDVVLSHGVFVQVLVSLMGCPLNQRVWPRVVGQDICRHLEHLRSQAVTLRGRAQGQILLPLPLCVERKDEHQLRYHSVCVTSSFSHLTLNLLTYQTFVCVARIRV